MIGTWLRRHGRLAVGILVVALCAPAALAQNAIVTPFDGQSAFGESSVKVSGNGKIDAEGGGAVTARSNSLIRTDGNGVIAGDAVSGGSVTVVGNGGITGTVTENGPALALPALIGSIKGRANKNDNAKIGTASDGSSPLQGTDFEMTADQSITLPAGTYYFTRLKLTGNAVLRGSGTITIALDGELSIEGNAQLNPDHGCSLLVLCAASAPKGFQVSGNGKAWGGLYGMKAQCKISGDGEVFGGATVLELDVTGNGALHGSDKAAAICFEVDLETGEASKIFSDNGGG